MTHASAHIPVMLKEVIATLAPRENGVYIDGTFGRGGYTRAILQAAKTHVWALDRDATAIEAGRSMEKEFAPRLTLIHGCFGEMDRLLDARGVKAVDGVALDLGVSSPQLDDATRGFSFRADGPLDMRMSDSGRTAADVVNTESEQDLANIIFEYGEERHSRRVARAIIAARAEEKITRTLKLANIVRKVVPASRDGIDPATRTFQALRIYVNDELGELENGLAAAEKILRPEGRLVVVAFHSLEDRCVKDFMRTRSAGRAAPSRHVPQNDNQPKPTFKLLTRKPLTPSEEEMRANPRARSARLRAAERTEAAL